MTAETTREIRRGAARFAVTLPEKLDRDYWAKVADGRWEPETFALFDARLGPGARLVDIGAWIGPTALYAAALGAEVTAFEPDPAALAKLRANLTLNPELAQHVTVEPVALAGDGGGPGGTVTLATEEAGNSMSGRFREAAEHLEVPARTPEAAGLPALFAAADLVKLDIEGGEFELLPALAPLIAATRPVLHLSLHALFLPQRGMGRAERVALQRAALDAVAGYAHVYLAEGGAWRRLDAPARDLAALADADRLTCSIVLADDPIALE